MKNKVLLVTIMCIAVINTIKAQDDPYLLQKLKCHKGEVISVALSSDTRFMASGGEDKMIYIYDIGTGEETSSFSNYYVPRGLIATQNGQLVFGSGSAIVITDLNGTSQGLFEGNITHIQSVDMAFERNKLIAGSYDKTVKIWDIKSAEVEVTLEGHKKNALAVCFSPDEKYAATGSLDRTVKTWNTTTGEMIRSMEMHSDNILDVEFHPWGSYLLSASLDNTIRLWDFKEGKSVKTYTGHDKGVTDVEFLPDGYHFVSSSYDGTIILWETFTGKKVYSFILHEGAVNCLDVSPDGKYMVSGGKDHIVYLWDLDKRVFVDYFFEGTTEKIMSESDLFLPKQKGEDKEAYLKRKEEAKIYLDTKLEDYYKKYIDTLKTKQ